MTPVSKLLDEVPDVQLHERALRERSELGAVRVRPFVHELVRRGHVNASEWAVPMNTHERQLLIPVLDDDVFVAHFLHCVNNVGPGEPGTYTWALIHELAPEAMRRWYGADGVPPYKLRMSSAYGRMGWAGGRTVEQLCSLVDLEIDARSAYPTVMPASVGSEAELEQEAFAMVRRLEAGIDGLDWGRRVLARALQLGRLPAPLPLVEDRTEAQLRADGDFPDVEER